MEDLQKPYLCRSVPNVTLGESLTPGERAKNILLRAERERDLIAEAEARVGFERLED